MMEFHQYQLHTTLQAAAHSAANCSAQQDLAQLPIQLQMLRSARWLKVFTL